MKYKAAITNNILFKAYNTYRNYTPIHVLTANETIIFNTIVFSVVAGFMYWAMFVVPSWLLSLSERVYYYLTGQTISVSIICSLVVRQLMYASKPTVSRTNPSNTSSDFYRRK